ncbi:hypothetical protein [Sphingomonas sp.]|uniref:F0F1 ATP synthase subunit B family protein n=1 Tax=Sphingomonas sp. TaxID=28214 RepID=UPI001B027296|nr:hypothetical protein [Sphingomonas sp.]MBO9715206.1 hypothetical protein [Sphingomonas sp.]
MAEEAHQGMTAATGTVELHHEPTAFGLAAPGWVALSMLVVVAIILWQKMPAAIGRMLDAKIDGIKRQLDEAARLRQEAEAMLIDAQTKHAASAADAAAIVAHAEAEAAALLAKAETDADELVARRGRMAEDKIAAAERTAIAEVRARAAEAAAQAAAAVIAEKHGAAADKALVDKAIAGLSRAH